MSSFPLGRGAFRPQSAMCLIPVTIVNEVQADNILRLSFAVKKNGDFEVFRAFLHTLKYLVMRIFEVWTLGDQLLMRDTHITDVISRSLVLDTDTEELFACFHDAVVGYNPFLVISF